MEIQALKLLPIKLETYFGHMGHTIFQNRFKALFGTCTIIIVLMLFLPRISVDTSWEGMLHKDDPFRVDYNQFRDQFGRDEFIIVAVKSENVFTEKFLKNLKALHNDLENKVPYIKDVTSLINARSTRGDGDTLYVDDLLKDWPEKTVDLSLLKKQVMNNPLYLNNYISEDGTVAALIIETVALISDKDPDEDLLDEFDEGEPVTQGLDNQPDDQHYLAEKENLEVVDAIDAVLARYDNKVFSIAVTGGPVIETVMNRSVLEDLSIFVSLTYVVIIFFLASLFRRISGVILPLLIVVFALLSTMSIMAISGASITQMTVIIPCLLSAVGTADAVHILAVFFRRFQQGCGKEEAIAYAMAHSGPAVVMTSITTAAGFLSFAFSEMATIGELGLFTAIGVMIALIYTVIMLPALLSIIPLKVKPEKIQKKRAAAMDRFLLFFADFSTAHPVKITVFSVLLLAVFSACLFRLEFSIDTLNQFPESKNARRDAIFIDDSLRGSLPLEIIIDTGKENGIHDPAILKSIESVSRTISSIKIDDLFVGKVFSIIDILKETHQALNGNDPLFYKIPEDRALIAQEMLLFENSGSDDLEKVVDSQFKKTRMTLKIPYVDVVMLYKLIAKSKHLLEEEFAGKANVTITGMGSLMGRTLSAALRSMVKSYILIIFVITAMMIFFLGSLKYGLVSMFPNILPIILMMGILGAWGLPLDLNALLMGSIGIGLVVDDTMHFMYNFRKFYTITGSVGTAVRETLLGTGRAMLITTLVLSSSFYVSITGKLKTTLTFGLSTGTVIVLALLADFFLAPALMKLITKDKEVADVVNEESLDAGWQQRAN